MSTQIFFSESVLFFLVVVGCADLSPLFRLISHPISLQQFSQNLFLVWKCKQEKKNDVVNDLLSNENALRIQYVLFRCGNLDT